MSGRIKKIKVQAYQSHEQTELNLSPGVNVILGKSTSGKTAIFRSVNTLLNNEPTGYRYHKRDSEQTTNIGIEFDDEVSVEFKKDSKKGASYNLKVREDSFDFFGFGRGVPDLVRDSLNLGEVNIQAQLDPHYLVLLGPAELAKKLGRVAGLDKTEAWVQVLNKRISHAKNSISDTNETIHKLEVLLKEFNLERTAIVEKEVASLVFLISKSREVFSDVTKLTECLNQLKKLNSYIEARNKDLDKVNLLLESLLKDRGEFLSNERFFSCYLQIVDLNKAIAEYDKVKYYFGIHLMMVERYKEYRMEIEKVKDLKEKLNLLSEVGKDLFKLHKDFSFAKNEYIEILKSISVNDCIFCAWRGRGACPVGGKVTKEHIDLIIDKI